VAVLAVRIYGDPVLRKRAAEVKTFDDALRRRIADMRETMHAYQGVGLAATQVGVLERVLVVDVPLDEQGESRAVYALVNPVIESRASSQDSEEGCLSIPGIFEDVTRALEIRVRYRDEHGNPAVLEAEGYLARAIQHEIDHLNGVLFVDRLGMLQRQLHRKELKALEQGKGPAARHQGPAL